MEEVSAWDLLHHQDLGLSWEWDSYNHSGCMLRKQGDGWEDVGSSGETPWELLPVINLNANSSFIAKLPRSPSNDAPRPIAVAQGQYF